MLSRIREIDWDAKVANYQLPDGSVVIPPRIARDLDTKAGMAYELRIALRATDPEGYAVLEALHLAGLRWKNRAKKPSRLSGSGQPIAPGRNHIEKSATWMTTSDVAALVGVDDRTVRRWARKKRIPAARPGRQWLIHTRHIPVAQALAAA